ncbi:hypothetical protein ScPMuIL_010663 [Solemya velum]
MVKKIRRDRPNTLLLDAGDQFQGTLYFYHYGGAITSHFMELLGYDAMALGNHEFDRGVDGLVPFLKNVSFPVLSCNINSTGEPEVNGLFGRHVVLQVGGEKIGVIGYTTKSTPLLSNPGSLIFNDEVESIRKEVDILQSQGINKIIALGHSGFKVDKQIAREVHGLDVVIGGHTDTFLYTGDAPSNEEPEGVYPTVVTQEGGGEVLVVQDYTFGKYLGFLEVSFDENGKIVMYGGNPILLNASVEKDPEMHRDVEKWGEGVAEFMTSVKGKTLFYLEGSKLVCRVQECNLGNLIADAFVHQNLRHADNTNGTSVFICLFNSGGIRDSIAEGAITVGNVLGVIPFRNTVDTLELKGQYLYEALEHSVANYDVEDKPGGFLQFSGLKVTYNIARPPGQRVVEAKVRCTNCHIPDYVDIDKQATYKVIMPFFLANGGDGFSMIKEHATKESYIGDLDTEIFLEYIQSHSPLYQGVEGRITFVSTTDPCISSAVTNELSRIFLVVLFITITFCHRHLHIFI